MCGRKVWVGRTAPKPGKLRLSQFRQKGEVMKYGVVMRTDIDLDLISELACDAEKYAWDGFFVWDGFLGPNPWILLASVATRTEQIRFGVMVTAATVRRPWQLASETATLDRLSKGRLILSLGLGAADDLGFDRVGEQVDRKLRAELLDETIDLLKGLWTGQPFRYEGKNYRLRDVTLNITPMQQPRIPIWVVGAWPRMKSMRRVLRCDGLIPAKMTPIGISDDITTEDLREISAFVKDKLGNASFDIIMEGETPGHDKERAAKIVGPFIEAGATWWLEGVATTPYRLGGVEGVRTRIVQGPPRLD
jgi:hypothetical protein